MLLVKTRHVTATVLGGILMSGIRKIGGSIRSNLAIAIASTLMLTTSITQARPPRQHSPGPRQGGSQPPSNPGPKPPPSVTAFGDPLLGLTGEQLTAFTDGQDNFQEVDTVAFGLGPIFNGKSCAECHSVPSIGGSSEILVTRFGHSTGKTFDPLTSLGGSLLQDFSIDPTGIEHIPQQANVIAHRQSTPLFGLGLIEAIPDATILGGVRTKPVDGILGRACMVADVSTGKTLVGRFGWKAQHARLLSFAGDAYVNEVGITNRLFPTENAPNGNAALLKKLDTVPDPEDITDATGKADIDRLADFMQLLAPPPALPMNASTLFGGKIFMDVGCAKCHTSSMVTGPNKIGSLDSKRIMLFSDLLLHDMGSLGDGIGQGAAGPREMKTPPLWGARMSGPYLHDGRAPDLDTAIKEHDGEAKEVRDRYNKLAPDQKKLLIEFLNSI